MTTLVRPVQLENALSPISVTLSGMTTLARLLQPSNASAPISVTLSGMTTLVRLVQKKNAPSPIFVTLSGITTSAISSLVHFFNIFLSSLKTSPCSSALRIASEPEKSLSDISFLHILFICYSLSYSIIISDKLQGNVIIYPEHSCENILTKFTVYL